MAHLRPVSIPDIVRDMAGKDPKRNNSAPPAQSFRGSARRPPGGIWGRMQDVVCQLVGIGLVPRYVMKAIGVEGAMVYVELLLYQLWLLYQLFQFV